MLNDVRSKIEIYVSQFTNDRLSQSIAELAKMKMVKVMIHQHHNLTDNDMIPYLSENGVEVRTRAGPATAPSEGLMHYKFAIIDGDPCIWHC